MKNGITDILYQDRDIAVCIKPVGVLSEGEGMPALLKPLCAVPEIYCVHRLDRAVGGVMVYAKSSAAAAKLSAAMSDGRFVKEYLCLVHGCPEAKEAQLCDLLFKDSHSNKSYVVKRMRKGVKEARLEYTVLHSTAAGTGGGAESAEESEKSAGHGAKGAEACEGRGVSLLRVRLHTGRSHQIRVQFSSRRMPLVGDVKYGSSRKDCPIALWSCSLSFPHPRTGETMRFSAPPPNSAPWDELDPAAF